MCYFEFIFKKSSVPGIVLKRLKQNLETSFPASLKHETRFQNKMNKELIAFFWEKSDSFKNRGKKEKGDNLLSLSVF